MVSASNSFYFLYSPLEDLPKQNSSRMQAVSAKLSSIIGSITSSKIARASLIGACVVVGGVLCHNPITIAITAIAGAVLCFYLYKNKQEIKKELVRASTEDIVNKLLQQTERKENYSQTKDAMIRAAILIRHEGVSPDSFSNDKSPKELLGFGDPRDYPTFTKEKISILKKFEKKISEVN